MGENYFNFPSVYEQASSDARRPACLLELTALSRQCGGGSDKKQKVVCCQVRFGSALLCALQELRYQRRGEISISELCGDSHPRPGALRL